MGNYSKDVISKVAIGGFEITFLEFWGSKLEGLGGLKLGNDSKDVISKVALGGFEITFLERWGGFGESRIVFFLVELGFRV